jgi:hypothetical protein
VAAAGIIGVVLLFSSAGCSYRLDSLKSRSEIELKGSKLSESASLPSDADLAVARAAASEMLDKGGKTASMPWDDPAPARVAQSRPLLRLTPTTA